MKKFLLGLSLLTILLFSCNKDDDNIQDLKEPKKEKPKDNFGYEHNATSIGLPSPPTWLRGKFKPGVYSYKEQANKSTIEITNDDIIVDGESFKEKFKGEKIYLDIGKRRLVGDNNYYSNDNGYVIYERMGLSRYDCYIYIFELSEDGEDLRYRVQRSTDDKVYPIRYSLYDKVEE